MAIESSRRGFLMGAASAGISLPVAKAAVQTGSAKPKIAANDRIQLAAIGLGIMGNKDVVTARKIAGVELRGVCDLYSGRLEAAKEKYGSQLWTTKDYREVLSRSDVDAVIIATCDKWHAPIAIAAMEAGKAVYCEKPVVQDISEGAGVLEAQRKTNAVMQVGSQWVSSLGFQKAREQLKAGAIGELNCIAASYDRQSALGAWEYTMPLDASPQTVDWDRYTSGGPSIPYDAKKFFWWRNYREFGTGVAGDLFVHLLSGAHLVTNSKGPTRIYSSGELAYWKDGRNVPDVLTAIMDYPETAEHPAFPLTLRVDFASGNGEKFLVQFVGSEGIMELGFRGYSIYPHRMAKAPGIGGWDSLDTYPKAMQAKLLEQYNKRYSKAEQKSPSAPAINFKLPDDYDEHVVHFQNFFDAMRGKATVNEGADFGFRAAAPSIACNQSYFQKRVICWDPVNMRVTG